MIPEIIFSLDTGIEEVAICSLPNHVFLQPKIEKGSSQIDMRVVGER